MSESYIARLREDAEATVFNGDNQRIWQFDGLEMTEPEQCGILFNHGGSGSDETDFGTIWKLYPDGKLERRHWRGDGDEARTPADETFEFSKTTQWEALVSELEAAFETATAGLD